jgi:trehalose 6-phosphate phosphatase
MRHLLARSNRAVLVALARENALFAFDFDGTLAPLIPDRDNASMRPATHTRLKEVARAHRCAIITGRSVADMEKRLIGVPLAAVVGNHGMEPSADEDSFEHTAQSWVPALTARIARIDGAELENKRLSLSVHYWRSAAPMQALREILAAAEQLGPTAIVVRGHAIVNLIPRGAAMKSGAMRRLMREMSVSRALFAGDDLTDEEAFRSLDHESVITVRVGRDAHSGAEYYLRSQTEIDDLLDSLHAMKTAKKKTRP